jgi:hypothetical protein
MVAWLRDGDFRELELASPEVDGHVDGGAQPRRDAVGSSRDRDGASKTGVDVVDPEEVVRPEMVSGIGGSPRWRKRSAEAHRCS